MTEAQAPQPFLTKRIVGESGDIQPFFISDNNIFNETDTVDQDADLASDLFRELPHARGKFPGQYFTGRNPAAVEFLQSVQMACLQAGQVTVKLSYRGVLSSPLGLSST